MPTNELREVFLDDAPVPGYVHILVEVPSSDNRKRKVSEVTSDYSKRQKMEQEQQDYVNAARQGPTPSAAAQLRVHQFITEQTKPPMLNSRSPQLQGLPVGLYHPVFNEFQAALHAPEAEITSEQFRITAQLVTITAAIYDDEAMRRKVMERLFEQILSETIITVPGAGGSNPVGDVITTSSGLLFCRAIWEWQNEIGTGGSDAATLGSYSYRSHWDRKSADKTRAACCCPSFIVAIGGPWMAILGAIWVKQPISQPLTDYIWIGGHASDDNQLHRIVRILLALKRSLQSLDHFYRTVTIPAHATPPAPANFAHTFPYVNSYRDHTGQEVQFDYLAKLAEESPHTAVFKAKTMTGELIVVKFPRKYNAHAHRLLADINLAPRLLYPGMDEAQTQFQVGSLRMVVMAFVDGRSAYDAYEAPHTLPSHLFKNVQDGIDALHKEGVVFGDLRPPNIMITNEKAVLVDFDWCATDGVGRYPAGLNDGDEDIGWHEGVGRNAIMRKEHDIFMLQKLRPA